MALPAPRNVDLRYSRFVPIQGQRRLETAAEFGNILNTVRWSVVGRVVSVDAAGNSLSPIATDAKGLQPTSGYEQREFRLGFEFSF